MSKAALIIIHGLADSDEAQLVKLGTELNRLGLLREFLLVSKHRQTNDPVNAVGTLVSRDSVEESTLAYLARQRALQTVVVASITTKIDVTPVGELALYSDRVLESVQTNSPTQIRVLGARLCLPTWSQHEIDASFFSLATTNLCVIPEDRSSEGDIAQPIEKDGDYLLHVFFEMSSCLGIWQGMTSSAVELRPPTPAGVPDSVIYFVRSFVRILRGPAPALAELLPAGTALPIPVGFSRSSDPDLAIKRLTNELFPQEFSFQNAEYVDPREKVSKQNALGRYVSELRDVGKSLPTILRTNLVGDLNDTAARLVQSLYGQHSWVQVEGVNPDVEEGSNEEEAPVDDEIVKKLEKAIERPTLNTESNSTWRDLINGILGSIDGSEKVAEKRESSIGTKVLLNDREDLAWGESQSSTQSLERSDAISEEGSHGALRLTLLDAFTLKFREQIHYADKRIEELVAFIRHAKRASAEVSSTVTTTLFVSLISIAAVFLWSIVSLTQLHSLVSFDSVAGITRARLWTILTATLLLIAGVALPAKDSKQKQITVITSVSIYAVVIAMSLVYFRPIRRWVITTAEQGREAPLYLLSLAVAGFVLWVLRKALVDEGSRSVKFRIVLAALLVYAYFALLVASSRQDSTIQNLSQGSRQRLLTFVIVFVILVTLGIFISICFFRLRERHRFQMWIDKLRWTIVAAEDAMRQSKGLKLRLIQWLGTASSLNYVIWNPLGREFQEQNALPSTPKSGTIQKTKIGTIELSEDGNRQFVAKVRAQYATPGWLTGQYTKASTYFAKSHQTEIGTSNSSLTDSMPDTCSYPQTREQTEDGEFLSRRWMFAADLIAGKIDPALSDSDAIANVGQLYQAIIGLANSYAISGESIDIPAFLSATQPKTMVPAQDGESDLPAGFLGGGSFVDSHGRQSMKVYRWWPSHLSPAIDPGALESEPIAVDEGMAAFAGRIDISEPFRVSEFAGSQPSLVSESSMPTDLDL